jgi:hypothetical protein
LASLLLGQLFRPDQVSWNLETNGAGCRLRQLHFTSLRYTDLIVSFGIFLFAFDSGRYQLPPLEPHNPDSTATLLALFLDPGQPQLSIFTMARRRYR